MLIEKSSKTFTTNRNLTRYCESSRSDTLEKRLISITVFRTQWQELRKGQDEDSVGLSAKRRLQREPTRTVKHIVDAPRSQS